MTPVKLTLENIHFFIRNVSLRLPFRYGNACLVAAPLLHTRLMARGEDGRAVTGVCADMLPPKWFDKSPEKKFRDNIHDLLTAAHLGRDAYLGASRQPDSAFDLWHAAYPGIRKAARARGLNGLTSSFGSSIIERAVIDAACKVAGTDFFTMLKENGLGIDPGTVHGELMGTSLADALPAAPLDAVYVRHTVGLGDPLAEKDLTADTRLDDGLPQSLEAWIRQAGVRYFKIKIQGDITKDLSRLRQVMDVLHTTAPQDYRLTLDGNEQFHTAEELQAWLEAISADPLWYELSPRIIFIEQPLERAIALTEPLGDLGCEPWPPIIIDESDDHLDALKQAVAQGYRGTSVKNCKGVFQALLNKLLIDHYNATRGGGYILSSEDLCNQPLLPLQQDLCTLSVLGVAHSERNGHHYVGSLSHVPPGEMRAALEMHPSLYEPFGQTARLSIRDGKTDLTSLRQPGYGTAVEPEWESMPSAESWAFESLGIDEP